MNTHAFTGQYVRLLTIAGSDSGGGAGIQADLKTFSALGCFGMTAITALTAQNTQGVQAIHGVPASFLKAQLQSVLDDIGVDALKIGMLHAPDIVEVVAWAIDHYQLNNVVLDPVMVATSGDRLIAEETVSVLVRQLFPRVQLVTPNLDEAALLLERPLQHVKDLQTAADDLHALGAQAVLLKGGHLEGNEVVDVLVGMSEEVEATDLDSTTVTVKSPGLCSRMPLRAPQLTTVQGATGAPQSSRLARPAGSQGLPCRCSSRTSSCSSPGSGRITARWCHGGHPPGSGCRPCPHTFHV
jgi:hydroxymethylpyrimidine kinase/phosphomethylpyrimidine kinase